MKSLIIFVQLVSILLFIQHTLSLDVDQNIEVNETTTDTIKFISNTTNNFTEKESKNTTKNDRVSIRKPKTIYGLLGFLTGFRFAQGIGPTSYHADRREDAQLSLFSKLFDGALYLSYIKYPYFYPLAQLIQPMQQPLQDNNIQSELMFPPNFDITQNNENKFNIQKQMEDISQQLVGNLKNNKFLINFENPTYESEEKLQTNFHLPTKNSVIFDDTRTKIQENLTASDNNSLSDYTTKTIDELSESNTERENNLLKASDIGMDMKGNGMKNETSSNVFKNMTITTTAPDKKESINSTTIATTDSPSTVSYSMNMSFIQSDNKTTSESADKTNMTNTTQSSNHFYPYPYYHHYSNASHYTDVSLTESPDTVQSESHQPYEYYNPWNNYYNNVNDPTLEYHPYFSPGTKYHNNIHFYPNNHYYDSNNFDGNYYHEDKLKYSKKMEESGFVPLGTLSNKI